MQEMKKEDLSIKSGIWEIEELLWDGETEQGKFSMNH